MSTKHMVLTYQFDEVGVVFFMPITLCVKTRLYEVLPL